MSRSHPDAGLILARFPGPVTLRPSRLKWLSALAGALAFVLVGVSILGGTPSLRDELR